MESEIEEIEEKDSILLNIKKLLGILPEEKSFDVDIIIYINSVFNTLSQLGVNTNNAKIKDSKNTWSEFYSNKDDEYIELIKTYMYLKVRLLFDPPLNSSILNSFKETIRELEWRLNINDEKEL
jgi:hypothetical protein